MKKFIAIIAAIAMIATMSVSVFAADATLTDTTSPATLEASKAVSATYTDGDSENGTDEIWLDVTWTDTSFTYSVEGKIWDETKLAWIDNTGSWTDNVAKVDVANRSSVSVKVDVSYDDAVVAADFDKETDTLAVGTAGETTGTPTTTTFTLTVANNADAITANVATAGTITLKVAKAA